MSSHSTAQLKSEAATPEYSPLTSTKEQSRFHGLPPLPPMIVNERDTYHQECTQEGPLNTWALYIREMAHSREIEEHNKSLYNHCQQLEESYNNSVRECVILRQSLSYEFSVHKKTEHALEAETARAEVLSKESQAFKEESQAVKQELESIKRKIIDIAIARRGMNQIRRV